MNTLQSALLSGAAALTLATSAVAETTSQSVASDSAREVTHILADTTNTTLSDQSDPWNPTVLFLELGSTIALGAFVYLATKRSRNGR